MKELMIETIRRCWFFEPGSLESMGLDEVREIYEALIDWLS